MNTAQFQVSGMVNQQGRTQMKNALEKLTGVSSVAIDLKEGKVSVGYNDPATQWDIADCIMDTGFTIEQ